MGLSQGIAWLCFCTVHWRQKSLITQLQAVLIVTDLVQEQKSEHTAR